MRPVEEMQSIYLLFLSLRISLNSLTVILNHSFKLNDSGISQPLTTAIIKTTVKMTQNTTDKIVMIFFIIKLLIGYFRCILYTSYISFIIQRKIIVLYLFDKSDDYNISEVLTSFFHYIRD